MTALPVAVDKVEAVYLEFMPGVLRDALHVPFQQACKIVDDLLLAGVGVAGPQGIGFGQDLKHTKNIRCMQRSVCLKRVIVKM